MCGDLGENMTTMADTAPEMSFTEVGRVLQVLGLVGCRFWVEGGWGVDALVGRQTRPHRDLDLDVDAASEPEVIAALRNLGYEIETDWRPNRVELGNPDRGWVDLHPLLLAPDGSARQAALGGGFHEFPPSYFATGRLHGTVVPCLSAQAQRAFRKGYQLRPQDHHDLSVLDQLTG